MAMIICPECGKEISDQADVCINCGYNLQKQRSREQGKRIWKIVRTVIAILLIPAILFGVWKIFLPDLFTTAEGFLERGDYQRAYEKASDEDMKELILFENQIAVVCQDVVDSLKDSTSFVLSEAVYKPSRENHALLLSVMAHNSYGNNVTNYWVYDYESNGVYEYDRSFTDFDEETIYSWDDTSEGYEKALNNLVKAEIQLDLSFGAYDFLPEESVARINNLFAAGKLDDVVLIPFVDPSEETVEPTVEPDGEGM